MGEDEGQPAVVVHGAEQARAALAAAGPRGLVLLSAPGAAAWLGAPVFLAIVAAAAVPGVPCRAVLDCGADPGHALAALRAGCRTLVLDPSVPAFGQVVAAAATLGATVWPARPPALDLATLDLRRPAQRARLAAWLAGQP